MLEKNTQQCVAQSQYESDENTLHMLQSADKKMMVIV